MRAVLLQVSLKGAEGVSVNVAVKKFPSNQKSAEDAEGVSVNLTVKKESLFKESVQKNESEMEGQNPRHPRHHKEKEHYKSP
ncbi:MAG TPA: hypothetical protein VGL94_08995 [Ktedonobacteraceae bacterium]|jgi:hypothetical protein